eukprot:TRINITY_DN712_c0_g1_i3.p1 TRINITY_DN712_c0_g1~~TRINITY_DN712_c0_g1_i3.p1  ORF type:complete len:106 (+),score=8.57 TRINITY_DN712_c0_g1_i3:157-474(+)
MDNTSIDEINSCVIIDKTNRNPLWTHINWDKIEIRKSGVHGSAWVACAPIEEGEWVWRLTYHNRQKSLNADQVRALGPDEVENVFQFDNDKWEFLTSDGTVLSLA